MSMEKVVGSECLQYIDKPIAFVSHNSGLNSVSASARNGINYVLKEEYRMHLITQGCNCETTCEKWEHDTTKRKIGLITKKYEDGGLEVAILSNDRIVATSSGNISKSETVLVFNQGATYDSDIGSDEIHRTTMMTVYPTVSVWGGRVYDGIPTYSLFINGGNNSYSFDETLNYNPNLHWFQETGLSVTWAIGGKRLWDIQHTNDHTLTTDKTTTLTFGLGIEVETPTEYPKIYMDNPLKIFAGNFYQYACDQAVKCQGYFPSRFLTPLAFSSWHGGWDNVDIKSTNLTAIPFNLILTYDENQAQKYLRDGTLPSDAFLYPLDFENLPTYQSDETDDSDEDDGGNGEVDDNGRDTDENLPEVPSYTPGSLNNNNVYLMLPGELNQIINWLWNDVGAVQDIDDLINKIEGITSDLTQNLLMVRVMPVAPSWIGGLGEPSNFILGQVEKAGEFTTLGKANPTIEDIGYWDFSEKFSSFKFLNFAPYSEFKLFLPYHGIVDLDVSVFQGHRLNVKAVYDYLTGTITYMLYCDNTWLVNTYTAKMAVDLAITLQTKADRDSAIFNNVSNAVAGVMTAGSSIAAGNPIGLVLGAQSLTQQGQSAPFKAMGQVGETGAFYAPQKCAVLVRRPVYRKPETYNSSVGRQSYKSYTLAKLKGKGYTKIINPRLEFTKTQPLAEEVQELNDILSSGVIL